MDKDSPPGKMFFKTIKVGWGLGSSLFSSIFPVSHIYKPSGVYSVCMNVILKKLRIRDTIYKSWIKRGP